MALVGLQLKSLKLQFVVIFGLFILLSCSIMGVLAALSIMKTGELTATQQGLSAVEIAGNIINGDEFERFMQNPSENDPYYEETRLKLLDAKRMMNCQYLYTMVPVAGTVFRYVIDGSCDPSDRENFSPLGTDEDIEDYGDAPFNVMKNGLVESSGMKYQKEWGWQISTYKAITNSSGKVVGMIGVDFNIELIVAMLKSQIAKIGIVGILFLIIGSCIIFFLSQHIFGRVKVISDSMQKIAEGTADLTSRIPEEGNNEMTILAKNCNSVIASLNKLVMSLQNETGVLSDTGTELNDKMNDYIRSFRSTLACVDEIAQHIFEQSEQISSVVGGMRNVDSEISSLDSRLSEQSSAIQQSTSAVTQITSNIESIDKSVSLIIDEYEILVQESAEGQKQQDIVSSQIATIAQQSENLTEANAAISAIAEQTNLLAMNAAIEAAHAGEQGKGFAVVADEIRTLAETSASQSASISELLRSISDAIEGIVASSSNSSAMFGRLGEKINKLDSLIRQVQGGMKEENNAVQDILTMMKTLDETVVGITDASAHMKKESDSVFERTKNLQSIANETRAKSEEISQSMSEMKQSAENALDVSVQNRSASKKVSDMINGFKTGR